MITIGADKGYLQTNRSNIRGNLWATFNIDLQSNLGALRLSPRMQLNTGNTSNQGLSVAFAMFDQLCFTIAGTRVFKNSAFNLTSSLFTEDVSAGAITSYVANQSDMIVFNSTLCTTADQKVMSKVANGSGTGAWTQRATLTAGTLHKMCHFKKFNRLYYLDAFSQIKSLDTAWSEATSGSYFIDLGYTSGLPYTFEADDTYIWIGTVNQTPSGVLNFKRGASILVWDGISSTVTKECKIKAQGILALCPNDKGVMHALDTNGCLLAYVGSGFEEVGRLPLNRQQLTNAASGLYNSFVHPNGLTFTKNGTFQVLVNNLVGDSGATVLENLPSGIWEWSKDTGFVHRQALTYNNVATPIIVDYGQNRISGAGALAYLDVYSESSTGKPTIICGANCYTNASSTFSGIFIDDPLDTIQKFGYFVTTWLQSVEIKDTWNKIWVFFRQLLSSTDKIVVKYRSTESSSTEASITWVSTSSFTTTTNVLGKEQYEVEVIQGDGSGKCAHITQISVSGGTYTVTLDDTFTGVTTNTAKVRIQNWKKIGTITSQTSEAESVNIGLSFRRIQVKVCLQFTGEDELFGIVTNPVPQQLLT